MKKKLLALYSLKFNPFLPYPSVHLSLDPKILSPFYAVERNSRNVRGFADTHPT